MNSEKQDVPTAIQAMEADGLYRVVRQSSNERLSELYTHINATSGRTLSYRKNITFASRLAFDVSRSECQHGASTRL